MTPHHIIPIPATGPADVPIVLGGSGGGGPCNCPEPGGDGWDGTLWVPTEADVDGRYDPDGVGGAGWQEDPSEPGTFELTLNASTTEAVDAASACSIAFNPRDVLGDAASFPGIPYVRIYVTTPPTADTGIVLAAGWAPVTGTDPYSIGSRSVGGCIYDTASGHRLIGQTGSNTAFSTDTHTGHEAENTWMQNKIPGGIRITDLRVNPPTGNHPSNSSQASRSGVIEIAGADARLVLMAWNSEGQTISGETIRVRVGLAFYSIPESP